MNLPSRAVKLIREYSKPRTCPNWRNRKWICIVDLFKDITQLDVTYKDKRLKLYKLFISNIQNNYCWTDLYNFILHTNLHDASIRFGIAEKTLKYIIYN